MEAGRKKQRETKAVSVRFGLVDFDFFQSWAKRLGVPWTDLVRSAVKNLLYLVKSVADGWQIKLVKDGQEKYLAIPELEEMAEHLKAA
jgi:hypothetical protein